MTATPQSEAPTSHTASQEHQISPSMSKGITLGLARITQLLNTLGNPHLAVPIIHVAGTNGKGSVCAYIDSILRASSLKVGRFTSPHLVHVRDSITLQGKPLSESEYLSAHTKVEDANKKHDVQASPFELLAATAFQSFKDADPPLDLAVVEVGMGGSTDATNVCPRPLVTAITSVDMDHQAFLGNTVQEIATVKAGIIKQGRPCILAPQAHAEATEAVRNVARRLEAPLLEISATSTSSTTTHLSFCNQPLEVKLPLLGSYQAANATTAVAAVEALLQTVDASKAGCITAETVKIGLESTRWPGRLDCIEYQGINMLLDGAHNPASIDELANYLKSLSPKNTTFILALSSPRDPLALLKPLVSALSGQEITVMATNFSQPEGMPWVSAVDPSEVAKAAQSLGIQAQVTQNVKEALSLVKNLPDRQIVICGSLYLVADTYRLLESLQEV
ncbi:FolC bifunctional protein [Cystobasidium minutum MCA 4210]|uniref:FolC bifunctional protein n=1 Tax=Cystobasidium minutum MCA 4210 TaxID=1397322 RepID=UPI0034CD19BE|eukprot:jgi/Rhomi1/89199/CE89198_787